MEMGTLMIGIAAVLILSYIGGQLFARVMRRSDRKKRR